MSSAITNPEKVIAAINDFVELVKSKDGDRPISFVDENSFLGNKKYGEGYKMSVAESAQNELNFDEWDESWINSGKILERCKRAMRAKNPKHEKFNPDTERVFYEIYKSKTADEERTAFENAEKFFGKHYPLIAYLFFIKDPSRFLPVSPSNFDNIFFGLDIEYKLQKHCSWENYMGFIEIVKEVRSMMQKIIPDTEVRLIDAHSCLWVIGFKEWYKEHKW